MAGRLTKRKRFTEKNIAAVPKQSGVYVLRRKSGSLYVGMAEAGRLQERIKEQAKIKRGITSFRYRPTSSTQEAQRLEKIYRDRLNPKQKI